MKVKHLLTASALAALTFTGFAQDEEKSTEEKPKFDREEMMEQREEQQEAMRIAYITKEVGLTPEEAEKFWPVHNKMEAEIEAMKEENKPDHAKKLEELSDAEIEHIIQDAFEVKEKEIEIRKKYHAEFKTILPMSKLAKLYHAEKSSEKNGMMKAGASPRMRPGGIQSRPTRPGMQGKPLTPSEK